MCVCHLFHNNTLVNNCSILYNIIIYDVILNKYVDIKREEKKISHK